MRITFYQLAVMLQSGVNVLDALSTLSMSVIHQGLSEALTQVRQDIQSGYTLSNSMRRFPKVFPTILVELTRAGEETGRLSEVLTQATDWMTQQNSLKRKALGALTYPVVVGCVALAVNLLVLNFSLPQMEEMLKSLQVETPLLTKVVFGIGHTAAHPLVIAVGVSVLLLLWSARHRFMTFERRLGLTRMLHELPVVGPLLRATAVARIASTFNICLDVNLNVLKALSLSLKSCGNPAYEATLGKLLESIRDGESIAHAFSYFPELYPTMFCHSLQVGEESGQLTSSLQSICELLEVEVDSQVDTLGTMVEPILLGCCAVFVGVFVLATILPLQEFLSKLMT